MSQLKIAVYAIALNEAPFCERFYRSCVEADTVLVADTGSTDGTPAVLRDLGATVQSIAVRPWRFDDARNASLALLPADLDVCVCMDLDEVLAPGWREALERAWTPVTSRGRYEYTWSWQADGSPGLVFWQDKIHARHGYRWRYPCHETLERSAEQPEQYATLAGLKMLHYPDMEKSRASYLPLLELGAREQPNSARMAFYLARERFFNGLWEQVITEMERYLSLPEATWPEERSQALLLMARSYANLSQPDRALACIFRALAEAPGRAEAWLALAQAHYERQAWAACYGACAMVFGLPRTTGTYIDEAHTWGALPHDLAALAAYHLGLRAEAVKHGRSAIQLEPDNARLRENLRYYETPGGSPRRRN